MSEDRPAYDGRPVSPVVRALNAPFIKFYPAFARAFGGNDAAILLQHLIDWTRQAEDGWIYRTQADIAEATTITPRRQYAALKALQAAGAIEIKRFGIPAKNWYRVSGEAITNAVSCGTSSADAPIKFGEFAELAPRTRRSLKGTEEINGIESTTSSDVVAPRPPKRSGQPAKPLPEHGPAQQVIAAYCRCAGIAKPANYGFAAKWAQNIVDAGVSPDEIPALYAFVAEWAKGVDLPLMFRQIDKWRASQHTASPASKIVYPEPIQRRIDVWTEERVALGKPILPYPAGLQATIDDYHAALGITP